MKIAFSIKHYTNVVIMEFFRQEIQNLFKTFK